MNMSTIFSDLRPVIYTAELLCSLKDFSGGSWIQTIVGTTIIARVGAGLPIAISQQRAIKRLEDLKPELQQLAKDLGQETALAVKKFGWDEKTAKKRYMSSFKKHWRKLVEEHNCHPMKSVFLAVTQIPIWICFSSGLRNIVYGLPEPRTFEQGKRWMELYSEALPWVENLTVADPLVLPGIFLTANLLNIALNMRKSSKLLLPKTKLQKVLPWVLTGGVVGISVFACYVPSAITLYWATSSSVALTQNIILMHPRIRMILKLPIDSPSEQAQSASKRKP